MTSCRANCFDASALVKVFVTEQGSDLILEYFYNRSPTKYTTPFCFYETLNVLKVKWMYRHEISRDEYTNAAFSLTAWFGCSSRSVRDIDFSDPVVSFRALEIVKQYSLDLSDAFQILSVRTGYFAGLVSDSSTILVTADKRLAETARAYGVRAWYFLGEPEP